MNNIYLRYSLYAVLLSLLVTMLRSYNDHWIERSDHASSAELYLKSDVCQKAELRVQLGKWQRCAESKYELRVRPAVRALYDTLEDFSICGHKRCEALVTWFQHNKMFILVFASFSAWCLYEFYKWQQQMNMVNRFMDGRLPGMLVN
jgi:hypothetical protein|tara:strand:- start:52 stop:492 length:441 start_codon:yes stop_codon:yes gene_type:complete